MNSNFRQLTKTVGILTGFFLHFKEVFNAKSNDKTAGRGRKVKYLGDTHELLDEALVLDIPEVNPLVGNVQQSELVRLAERKGLIRNNGSRSHVNTCMQIMDPDPSYSLECYVKKF